MRAGSDSADGRVLHRRDGYVLRVELSNPERRNALTWEMYEELGRLASQINDDPDVRVVVIRGADGTFAAGTDIRQFKEFRTAEDGIQYERWVGNVLNTLLSIRVPIVGVIEGPAVGGGLSIAACCDVLVANEKARFGIPIARTLGNIIAPAVMERLRDRLGPGRSIAMLLTSKLLSVSEAAAAGFVHAVVSDEQLEQTVEDVVTRIAGGAPLTLASIKELDRRLADQTQVDVAEDVLAQCYGSEDFQEGVSAFLEDRKPEWKGR